MNRNTKVLLTVSSFFGLGAGAYEFLLPYYLAERGISFAGMGLIFSLPAVGVLLLRPFLGGLSDAWGRKVFYAAGLAGTTVANWATAFVANVVPLTFLKALRDTAVLTRDTMHPIVLWEDNRARFLDFVGKTRGAEFMLMGLGTIVAGYAAKEWGNPFGLQLAAMICFVSLLLFLAGFREGERHVSGDRPKGGHLLSLAMERNLLLIAASGFVFAAGLSTSHCFVMPLFFTRKFGSSESVVAWVMLLHRFTIGVPMLLVGQLGLRHLKAAYISTMVAEGLALIGSVLAPSFLSSAFIWLLHDLIGAGIWQPIQYMIIQAYSNDATRGLEVGKVLTLAGLGGIIGPLVAGALFGHWVNGPFLLSGVLMAASAVPLFGLRLERLSGIHKPALAVR